MTDLPLDPLAELASFGPFFAVESHPAGASPSAPWRPLATLVEHPDALLSRVHSVQAALATAAGCDPDAVELRVAASVAQLGLVARVLSPALAMSVVSGQTIDGDLTSLWWQPELGGGFPLSVPDEFRRHSQEETSLEMDSRQSARRVAETVTEAVVEGTAESLVTAVSSAFSVSKQVLWGNVASAINGAATMICRQRPALGARTSMIATAVLGRAPFNLRDPHVGPAFRRSSCCLIYRVAPRVPGRPRAANALCGDCVLAGR